MHFIIPTSSGLRPETITTSILPTVSKMFEILLYNQISSFMENHFSPYLYMALGNVTVHKIACYPWLQNVANPLTKKKKLHIYGYIYVKNKTFQMIIPTGSVLSRFLNETKWKVSINGDCQLKDVFGKVSGRGSVLSWKWPVEEVSGRESVRLEKCPVEEVFVADVSTTELLKTK